MAKIVITANSSWYIWNFRSNLIQRYIQLGHNITVIAPIDNYCDKLKRLPCDFIPIKLNSIGINPVEEVKVINGYYNILKTIKPDIILSFTPKSNAYAGIAAHLLTLKLIPNISGLGEGFEKNSLTNLAISILYFFAFKKCPYVVFQNEDDLRLLIKHRIVSSTQSVRVPGSGVNLQRFQYSNLPNSKETVFLFASRLLWNKGIKEFIEAANVLRQANKRALFKIVGFIEPINSRGPSLNEIEEWQKAGIVEYLGVSDDIRNEIYGADCVVLPTYYREGVPRILLEASAMGRPIITTDNIGSKDAVDDKVTGFLCIPRDVKSLTRAMEDTIILGHDKRQKMGAAGRKKMEKEFDEKYVIDSYTNWINKLIFD